MADPKNPGNSPKQQARVAPARWLCSESCKLRFPGTQRTGKLPGTTRFASASRNLAPAKSR